MEQDLLQFMSDNASYILLGSPVALFLGSAGALLYLCNPNRYTEARDWSGIPNAGSLDDLFTKKGDNGLVRVSGVPGSVQAGIPGYVLGQAFILKLDDGHKIACFGNYREYFPGTYDERSYCLPDIALAHIDEASRNNERITLGGRFSERVFDYHSFEVHHLQHNGFLFGKTYRVPKPKK